jgi:hypothetical protein
MQIRVFDPLSSLIDPAYKNLGFILVGSSGCRIFLYFTMPVSSLGHGVLKAAGDLRGGLQGCDSQPGGDEPPRHLHAAERPDASEFLLVQLSSQVLDEPEHVIEIRSQNRGGDLTRGKDVPEGIGGGLREEVQIRIVGPLASLIDAAHKRLGFVPVRRGCWKVLLGHDTLLLRHSTKFHILLKRRGTDTPGV